MKKLKHQVTTRTELRGVICALFTIAALTAPLSALAETFPEVSNRLSSGDRIERDYILPLGIEGRTAASALDVLLAEGFRCGIVSAGEDMPGDAPMWYCYKKPSGYAPPCGELTVPARFAESVPWTTRDELLQHLDDIQVKSVRAFCRPPCVVPASYLAARNAAELELQSYVRSLQLSSDGGGAHKALLLAGFSCGLTRPPGDKESPLEMVCTKVPSQIKFCAEAKVVLNVAWPDGSSAQLYSALQRSRVREKRAVCEISTLAGSEGSESF